MHTVPSRDCILARMRMPGILFPGNQLSRTFVLNPWASFAESGWPQVDSVPSEQGMLHKWLTSQVYVPSLSLSLITAMTWAACCCFSRQWKTGSATTAHIRPHSCILSCGIYVHLGPTAPGTH